MSGVEGRVTKFHQAVPLFFPFHYILPVPTGPPRDLSVADRTTTSITLTWSDLAPDKINDRDGATGFEVRRNGQRVTTVTDRTYTFTGLSVATRYDFEVLAINDQGIAPDNHAAELTASTASEGMPTLAHLDLSFCASMYLCCSFKFKGILIYHPLQSPTHQPSE